MRHPSEHLLDAIGGVGLDLVEQSEHTGPFGGAWRRIISVAACLVLTAGITAAACFLPVKAATVALYNEAVAYDDGLYRWDCKYYVPQLNYDSPDAQAINAEIAENFGEAARRQLQNVKEKSGIQYTDIGAREYRNPGNILTLVCYKSYGQEFIEYEIYHFDTDVQTRLSNTDLLMSLDIEPAQYKAALRQAAASRYLRNSMAWGDYSPGQCPSDDFRWDQYRKTVSDENLDIDAVPMYVKQTDDGPVVTALPNIYALAGADFYTEEVTVIGAEPQWDASSAESRLDYRTILDRAWSDGMDATIYWTDPENPERSGVYDTVTLPRGWYYERFCVLLDGYAWTQYDGICPVPGNFWLNVSGGGINWSFWDDGDAGFLMIQAGNEMPVCWKADYLYDFDRESGISIAEALRHEYDGAAVSLQSFPLDIDAPTSDAVAQATAEFWGKHLCAQAPGSVYGATDYRVVSTNVRVVADPPAGGTGHAVLFDMTLAVKPMLEGYTSWLWAGNSYEGTGKWEGWLLFSREVVLQQLDGIWYIRDYGTGGLMLPEEHGIDCECPAEDLESPADSVEEAEPEYQQKAP